jgi:uncharacterized membrane protein
MSDFTSPNSAAPLPTQDAEGIQTIHDLHARHHSRTSWAYRFFQRSVDMVARPRFVACFTVFIVLWMAVNLGLNLQGAAFDEPPFYGLQAITGAVELYLMILLVVIQKRDGEIEETRAQLNLELAILNEKKSAKIIQLLEEMRRDNPAMADRIDPEADALSVPADTDAVSNAIESARA